MTETLLHAEALCFSLLNSIRSWGERPPKTLVVLPTLITKADLFMETPLSVFIWANTPLIKLTRVSLVGMKSLTRVSSATSVARSSKVDPFVTPGFATTTTRRARSLSTILPVTHPLLTGSRPLTIGRCFRRTLSILLLVTMGCTQPPLCVVAVKESR